MIMIEVFDIPERLDKQDKTCYNNNRGFESLLLGIRQTARHGTLTPALVVRFNHPQPRSVSAGVNTRGFHPRSMGSNPVPSTNAAVVEMAHTGDLKSPATAYWFESSRRHHSFR